MESSYLVLISKTELNLRLPPHFRTTYESHIWYLSIMHAFFHVSRLSQPILRRLAVVVNLAAKVILKAEDVLMS